MKTFGFVYRVLIWFKANAQKLFDRLLFVPSTAHILEIITTTQTLANKAAQGRKRACTQWTLLRGMGKLQILSDKFAFHLTAS
jgi:hypothetical protein